MKLFRLSLILLFSSFLSSCGSIISVELGNGLVLLEGDRKEDRIIVYCSSPQLENCYSGVYVIPSSYSEHMDDKGRYSEYVDKALSNEDWVISRTKVLIDSTVNYWIINKDFELDIDNCDELNCGEILQKQVIGPVSLLEFRSKCEDLKIDLSFD